MFLSSSSIYQTNVNFMIEQVGCMCPLQIETLVLVLDILIISRGFPKNLGVYFYIPIFVREGGRPEHTLRNFALESYSLSVFKALFTTWLAKL